MSKFILWFLVLVILIIAYNYLSYKLDVKTKNEKEILEKKEREIQNQSHVLDLKKVDNDIDFKEKLAIIEREKCHLDKFHQETISMIEKNEIANQDLINHNKLLKQHIVKLENELHHARQKSQRLAKIAKNKV
jgi:hypothetical protein